MLFGYSLTGYPDNFAFELTSRLVTLYGLKPYITNLIKQCDEQSPRHCGLIVPYSQIQPPGNGLIYSMNKHTMPVVDLDFIGDQSTAVSLSNKIIVISMRTGNTTIDINLPQLDEPYLNSTTIPHFIIRHTDQNMNKQISSDDDKSNSDDDDDEKVKGFAFLVNSSHHVYLMSRHGEVKFHQESKKGYSTVELVNRKFGLCILVEQNSNSVNFWDLGQNKLLSKIDLSANASIKKVLCSKLKLFTISIVLYNGTILFYTLDDLTFIHRGTINAGKHLDIVIADRDKLICTFDSTIPIDFAHIDLNSFLKTNQVLSDKDIVKTLIAFNPPITPKPFQQIILPDDHEKMTDNSMKIFFMILTKECLCIVHTCMNKDMSYVRIAGQYDVVSTNASYPHYIYTARRGIVEMFKWQCMEGEDNKHGKCDIYHKYDLFVSIDISSSSVLTIRPASNSRKNRV
jgi:hypothetical protein